MKLTNDEINQMAAELLGLCWEHKWFVESGSGLVLCEYCKRSKHQESTYPDFIHDANAVRELVQWFVEGARPDQEDKFEDLVYGSLDALAKPSKHITLAVLYAAGKITLEQAREAMEVPDPSEVLGCRVNPVLSRACQLGTKSCSVDHNQNCEAMEGDDG